MSVRPMSVCFRNDRRGAGANARLTPFASDEKMPSAPHTRNAMPMSVIVPARLDRRVDHAADRLRIERRGPHDRLDDELARRPLAEEVGEGHDAEDHELEEREDPEVGHAPGERERVVLEEPEDRPPRDPGQPVPKRPGVEASDEALQSVKHRSCPVRTRRAA